MQVLAWLWPPVGWLKVFLTYNMVRNSLEKLILYRNHPVYIV